MQLLPFTRNVLLLAVAGCLGGHLPIALAQDGPTAPRMVHRTYDLPEPKAAAFFELLAPNDVKVLVGRTDAGVFIDGTPAEARVLSGLAKLLERYADRDVSDTGAFIDELRPTWTTTEKYELSEKKLGLLFAVLAFDDVPVLVSKGAGTLTVQASKDDQKIVAGLAKILAGERLTDKSVVRKRRARGETKSKDKSAAKRGVRRERPQPPRRSRSPQPPSPPQAHDAEYHKSQLEHMRKCHQLIDRIHQIRGQRRDLERKSLQIQQDLEKLNEKMEQLGHRLDETEARLNMHLHGEHKG